MKDKRKALPQLFLSVFLVLSITLTTVFSMDFPSILTIGKGSSEVADSPVQPYSGTSISFSIPDASATVVLSKNGSPISETSGNSFTKPNVSNDTILDYTITAAEFVPIHGQLLVQADGTVVDKTPQLELDKTISYVFQSNPTKISVKLIPAPALLQAPTTHIELGESLTYNWGSREGISVVAGARYDQGKIALINTDPTNTYVINSIDASTSNMLEEPIFRTINDSIRDLYSPSSDIYFSELRDAATEAGTSYYDYLISYYKANFSGKYASITNLDDIDSDDTTAIFGGDLLFKKGNPEADVSQTDIDNNLVYTFKSGGNTFYLLYEQDPDVQQFANDFASKHFVYFSLDTDKTGALPNSASNTTSAHDGLLWKDYAEKTTNNQDQLDAIFPIQLAPGELYIFDNVSFSLIGDYIDNAFQATALNHKLDISFDLQAGGQKPTHKVDVYFVNINQPGLTLKDSLSFNITEGQAFSHQAPLINNFTYTEHKIDNGAALASNIASIPDVNANTSIIFYYTPVGQGTTHSILVEHKLENGSTLAPSTTHSVVDGAMFSRIGSISGYTCTGFSLDGGVKQSSSTASIAAAAKDYTITFFYKSSGSTGPGTGPSVPAGKHLITVHYEDENGIRIEETSFHVVQNNESFTKTANKMPGYSYSGYKLDSAALAAKETAYIAAVRKDHEIVFVYKKLPPLALEMTDHFWYVRGYEDNSVRPDALITRAEVATIVFRLLLDDTKNSTPFAPAFPDVKEDSWYSTAVSFLYEQGIIDGYQDGTFKPDQAITRAEMTKLFYMVQPLIPQYKSVFTDVDEDHWAITYILSAHENNYISGYPDGSFKPNNMITRAETATLINDILERKVDKNGMIDGVHVFSDLYNSHWAYYAIMEASHSHLYTRKENTVLETWTSITESGAQ